MCAEVKQLRATAVAQLHFSEFIDFCMLQSVDIMVKTVPVGGATMSCFFFFFLPRPCCKIYKCNRIQKKLHDRPKPTRKAGFNQHGHAPFSKSDIQFLIFVAENSNWSISLIF